MTPDLEAAVGRLTRECESCVELGLEFASVETRYLSLVLEGVRGSSADADTHRATAWVVLGSSGQWSDWNQWAVAVYANEQAAKDYVGSITEAVRLAMADMPEIDFDNYEESKGPHEAWAERLRAIDPEADEYDQPHYTAVEVPFFALATTAAPSDAVGMSEANEPNPQPTEVQALREALERAAVWLDDLAEVAGSSNARAGSVKRWKHDTVRDWARRTRAALSEEGA